jgi:hypothetical protein
VGRGGGIGKWKLIALPGLAGNIDRVVGTDRKTLQELGAGSNGYL